MRPPPISRGSAKKCGGGAAIASASPSNGRSAASGCRALVPGRPSRANPWQQGGADEAERGEGESRGSIATAAAPPPSAAPDPARRIVAGACGRGRGEGEGAPPPPNARRGG